MKLYFQDIKSLVANLDNLEIYKRSIKTNSILYSDEGIYLSTNNGLKKLHITDGLIKEYSVQDIPFIIDYSSIKYELVNKIPYHHYIIKKKLHNYSLMPKSKLMLVIEETNNKITDIFIETIEDIENPLIQNDIITLVSLLN